VTSGEGTAKCSARNIARQPCVMSAMLGNPLRCLKLIRCIAPATHRAPPCRLEVNSNLACYFFPNLLLGSPTISAVELAIPDWIIPRSAQVADPSTQSLRHPAMFRAEHSIVDVVRVSRTGGLVRSFLQETPERQVGVPFT
jgi:hypothetical protein